MGERLRLKADFDTSNFSPEVETILNAMKEYGVFVADNGIDWAISVAPDAHSVAARRASQDQRLELRNHRRTARLQETSLVQKNADCRGITAIRETFV